MNEKGGVLFINEFLLFEVCEIEKVMQDLFFFFCMFFVLYSVYYEFVCVCYFVVCGK